MNSIRIDLGHVARDLNLPTPSVERTAAWMKGTLFLSSRAIARTTRGSDEEQIRSIQFVVAKCGSSRIGSRRFSSIESQGKLTPELANQIVNATTPKRLEDLSPFKPKKQTLATKAREQGLEPLAVKS
jgi:uncharacterized protein